MRKILLILGIIIFIEIFYFAYVNQGQMLTLTYPPIIDQVSMNSGFVYLFLAIEGALAAFLITYYSRLKLEDKLKKQTRNIEKASVVVEESSDKVKSLQAKIDTLEIALKEALKK
ncbi:MAG: hypothetical protein A2287_01800 [Candidatus Melainabacteria bacterium RIFOXYA12_FULL_32_12]|nr:MAG: hypothetical protein A2255_01625 [Candidatus Melainabacteria bacterium RIFOXYA2_FULL_32_9]OGI27703.1 MAG: hypothetical protein A2287_01800 [Candidatus Melainabacteria bacterium RIFOXYA12_FULL_32_12]